MREKVNEPTVVRILDKLIEIANANNDESLKKWAHLESEGYYASNRYLTEEDIVPQYREVAGEHRDCYGKPLLISDPKLSFVNTARLRHSVAELESLSKRSGELLSIKDPETCKLIKEHLDVNVCEFVFNPASLDGVLNSIRQEAIRRSRKYITRQELMSTEVNQRDYETRLSQSITFSWLWENVPISLWLKLLSLLLVVFSLGLYLSGIPQIKSMLRYIPGYKVDLILPAKTADHIGKQLTNIVESHNLRLSELQKQLIYQEQLGGDHTLLTVDREKHQKAAQRIREIIREENQNFQNELKSLKSFLE